MFSSYGFNFIHNKSSRVKDPQGLINHPKLYLVQTLNIHLCYEILNVIKN
jgi:hypothetical protein